MPDNTSDSSGPVKPVPPLEEANAQVSLLGRIPQRHPVRLLALSVARGQRISTIQPLIDGLLDPSPDRWRIRAVAAWTLSRAPLTPEQTDAATASLMDVLEHARPEPLLNRIGRAVKRHVWVSFGGGALATFLLYFLFTSFGMWGPPAPPMFEVLWTLIAVVGVAAWPFETIASFLFDKSRDSLSRAAAAEALGQLGQPESVGALSGALFDGSERVREAAASALQRVLPLLTPEHFGLFGAQSITNLGRAVNHRDPQLVSMALAALNSVGTSHAIPFVRRAAQTGRTVRLRDAAADVLRVLEARQRSESIHSTLLRPTISPDSPASILVRPTVEAGADELPLRAAANADG